MPKKNVHESKVAQLCLTPCDPMDCSLPGFSVHGIFQARVLDGLPFPSPGDLPDTGIEPRSPTLLADALPSEPPGKAKIGLQNISGVLEPVTKAGHYFR